MWYKKIIDEVKNPKEPKLDSWDRLLIRKREEISPADVPEDDAKDSLYLKFDYERRKRGWHSYSDAGFELAVALVLIVGFIAGGVSGSLPIGVIAAVAAIAVFITIDRVCCAITDNRLAEALVVMEILESRRPEGYDFTVHRVVRNDDEEDDEDEGIYDADNYEIEAADD